MCSKRVAPSTLEQYQASHTADSRAFVARFSFEGLGPRAWGLGSRVAGLRSQVSSLGSQVYLVAKV
eukprot:1036703-Rhodomonas_salina.2